MDSGNDEHSRLQYSIPWEGPHGRSPAGFVRTLTALVFDMRAFSGGFPPGRVWHAGLFLVLVELLCSSANVAAHSVRAEHSLTDNLAQSGGLVGALLMVIVGSAALTHLIVRGRNGPAHWGDALRALAYAGAAYSTLRLSILPFFALRLESMPHFAGIAFVLWLGPLLFSAHFAIRGVRVRYRAPTFLCVIAVVVLPLLAVAGFSLIVYGPH